jgi:hypothetical protein
VWVNDGHLPLPPAGEGAAVRLPVTVLSGFLGAGKTSLPDSGGCRCRRSCTPAGSTSSGAETAPGWGAELNGTHIPETIEYGISSTVFRAAAPFHPSRLWDLLTTGRLAEFGALRSKGFLWLASRPGVQALWSQAGPSGPRGPPAGLGRWFRDIGGRRGRSSP